eukprot:4289426-Amphidinium_carterae.1
MSTCGGCTRFWGNTFETLGLGRGVGRSSVSEIWVLVKGRCKGGSVTQCPSRARQTRPATFHWIAFLPPHVLKGYQCQLKSQAQVTQNAATPIAIKLGEQ